jgi:hypothetical protein
VIVIQIDTSRRLCRRCQCWSWWKVSPRFGRFTPRWAAQAVWRLSLKGRLGLLLAGPLTFLLWRRVCQSCMIEEPTRLLLENQAFP